MTDDIIWREALVLTASCVMTLYASGQIESLLASLPVVCVCDERVSSDEKYCTYAGPDEDVTQKKEAINIQPLVEKGFLQIVSADCHVLKSAAKIASMGMIDDGETVPCALALQHDSILVTDYPYTIDLLTLQVSEIAYISTIDIFKYWVDTLYPTTQVIKNAVRRMGKRALYMPSVSHRWYSWWNIWKG